MGFLVGKKKLLFGVVAFFAPEITQALTGAVGWREAVRLSVLAAVGYCVAEGVADAGRAGATANKEAAETLAAARLTAAASRRRSTTRQDV